MQEGGTLHGLHTHGVKNACTPPCTLHTCTSLHSTSTTQQRSTCIHSTSTGQRVALGGEGCHGMVSRDERQAQLMQNMLPLGV